MTTTSEMRAAAEKATPGPWKEFICDDGGQWSGWPLSISAVNDEDKCIVRPGGQYPYAWDAAVSQREAVANARFIALANPTNVLALLDEVEALRARVERLSPLVRTETAPSETAIQVQLAAEVERLRAAADEFLRVDEQISHANRYGRDPGQEAYDDWAEKRGRLRALLTPAAEKV